ncbi:hypothetical protein M758_4G017600 [Ceratodon purpureus]|uniref:Uncharacterized protein n=1 Tax=Ceratodon purpureus TaxID=3225 RepID=A0A8T0I7C4_CERPU|nr:hypothetical protein KC19_4G019600 [Ceratodon purpureus]KAG0617822.1 hypothetical protein M758_4G017600 [Ceratodon purpureus]
MVKSLLVVEVLVLAIARRANKFASTGLCLAQLRTVLKGCEICMLKWAYLMI